MLVRDDSRGTIDMAPQRGDGSSMSCGSSINGSSTHGSSIRGSSTSDGSSSFRGVAGGGSVLKTSSIGMSGGMSSLRSGQTSGVASVPSVAEGSGSILGSVQGSVLKTSSLRMTGMSSLRSGQASRMASVPSVAEVSGSILGSVQSAVIGKIASPEVSWKQTAVGRISFQDATLLRGSFSTDVMRSWGAVLDLKQQASDWYRLSEHADHLDVFVSHNWSMPRMDKFLILALFLNFRVAGLCTAAVVLVVAPLVASGQLPTIPLAPGYSRFSPWCQVIGFAVFMLVLSCRQEVPWCSRRGGRMLFLDRACIHQTDDGLKQRGIEHLAAFLFYSWSMLICYSDEYLQKLWTVYEVASFLLLHPGSAIHVRHPWFTKFFIGGSLTVFVFNVVWHVVLSGVLENAFLSVQMASRLLTLVCLAPASVAVVVMVLRMTQERTRIAERVKHFRFDEARCYCEDDRAMVQRNIIAFMKHHEHVDADAADAEIIQEFEDMIHTEVPKLFAASLGRVGLPYHFAAFMMLPYCLQGIDYACLQFHDGTSAKTIFLDLVYALLVGVILSPLSLALMFRLAEIIPRKCGYKCSICIIASSMGLFFGGGQTVLVVAKEMSISGSTMALVAFSCVGACLISATFFFYKPIVYRKHHRRLDDAGNSAASI